MFSSEDEQDDRGIFDQLKCIRPFTIDQLYLLHPDVGCPPKSALSAAAEQNDAKGFEPGQVDRETYQYLVEHEQLRNQLIDLKNDIKKLYKRTHANIDNAWTFKEESTRKIAMCQQGKIAETTFKYKQAHIDKKHLEAFAQGFNELLEKITKDYIYYSFESQTKRNKIATHLSISYQTPDLETRKKKLKSAITTLIEFIRYSSDIKSDFTVQCSKWLRALARRFLEGADTNDYRFIISQLAKGPVGTADWSADLVECRPYEQVSGFESVPQYITHCSTLLSELFYSLQLRIKHVKANTSMHSKDEEEEEENGGDKDKASRPKHTDQNWSLVDPRFSCTEDLNISASSSVLLSESDVIKFCLRIPVAQIFRAYVKKCLDSADEFRLETDKNYEYIMLKLLTIGTIIIKTYQIGLETFNSIQYGSLIEYLSSQIRRTVMILSDQWIEFKHRLKGIDDALLMRLQVEYDSFMLRSILVILELRESGIWRHLSQVELETQARDNDGTMQSWATDSLRPAFEKLLQVTGISTTQQANQLVDTSADEIAEIQPGDKSIKALRSPSTSLTYEFSIEWFKEVSEPMLWHILWQFYHNGFMSSCDYHSDSYWLEKFHENSVVYLFVNKIRDSPPGECSYLINSITSMLLSRTKHDSKLVNFIAGELFNLTFKHQSVRDKVRKKGLKSLIRCAEKFPGLISLYISLIGESDDLDDHATELIMGCSLSGWLFDDDELAILERWLIEQPLTAPRNKIVRLIISKILLNSPINRSIDDAEVDGGLQRSAEGELFQVRCRRAKSRRRSARRDSCFVDLKTRRRLALLLYQASKKHFPENNEFGAKSLGASVEVAFGAGLYCEQAGVAQNNLMELATDASYQQFYIWTWRLLFTLRLHILNQSETDWNDVQSRSGTSRSIKNTVLINDPFHPVPSIEDSECSQLRDGLKEQSPIASFIYLILTDATWQVEMLESCVAHLNILANSGHITPSLMAMKYLTICHLNNLLEVLTKDKKCIEYFTTIILSNFDATRLASLFATQLDQLKQYRQLQLSHFYIRVLLEANRILTKRMASSWFSNNEISFEKVACLLDYLVRFNFPTQRLEIVRKFYDCAYVLQDNGPSMRGNGWLGSFMTSNSLERDLETDLHVLAQKFKKYTWLQWVNTECDALRLEKIWEDIVAYLSGNEDATLDSAIKKVCPNISVSSLRSTLPIFSWIRQIFEIMEIDLNHPLCPLIWYNFFLNYFANSLNGVSVGFKLISQDTVARLLIRLDSLYNYHIYKQRNWSSTSVVQQNSLTSLYKAYKLWLQDPSLRDAYIDIDRLRDDYLVPLLKAILESAQTDVCLQYIDVQSVETQNKNLMQVWIGSTRLVVNDNNYLDNSMVCLDTSEVCEQSRDDSMNMEDEIIANDAISLIVRSYKNTNNSATGSRNHLDNGAQEELAKPVSEDSFGQLKYQSTEELMDVVRRNFQLVFDESNIFGLNISELDRTRNEILDLVRHLYINKKREFVRVVPCAEGNECPGPARLKLEAEEAFMDERKSQCIQDRRRQCQELLGELLLMPRNRTVQSTVIIEDNIRRLISDPDRSKLVIETLLRWLSEPANYTQLNGSYYAANHLLKTTLEILSTTDQVDTYNRTLIDVCLAHPESVQVLSPHLSPSACSASCFLELYKIICSNQSALGTTATFVLLSKFDLGLYLNANAKANKQSHHEMIVTTCAALKSIGKSPDDTFALTMDLFKRHLHIELASPDRRKPDELLLVLRELLAAMSAQSLAPSLWLDYLTIIGLEVNVRNKPRGPASARKTSSSSSSADQQRQDRPVQMMEEASVTVESIADDVARLAETQMVFDHHAATGFMQTISEYMKQLHSNSAVTLLELHQDYLEQFGMIMLSATFMWLKSTSELYPDNHELIWKQFIELWGAWILLTKSCQNVSKTSYSLIASYFVVSLRYMMHKIPDNTCAILQSMLFELTNYVVQTREVIHLELTILQRCLKLLPWKSLIATPGDVINLATLSEQDNYNVSDLVSHVVAEMNSKEALARVQRSAPDSLARVSERLATVIVLQSGHLRGYKLYRRYFSLIPVDDIQRLANLVLARMDFANPESSHSNKLLLELLRFTCFDPTTGATPMSPNGSDAAQQANHHTIGEKFERSVIYARFVSNYLVDLSKRHQNASVNHNKKYLDAMINNALCDLEPMLSSQELGMERKIALYSSLLECCSAEILESNSRLQLAKSVVESHSLRSKPKLVVELVQAIGQFLRDARILVLMVETLVDLHRTISGESEPRIWTNFILRSISDESYLSTCVEEKAPLALLVYFESLFHSNASRASSLADQSEAQPTSSNQERAPTMSQIWAKFFLWLARLTQALCNLKSADHLDGSKLTTTWLRILTLFEAQLAPYLAGDSTSDDTGEKSAASTGTLTPDHKCFLDCIKQLISFYDSINTSGLWAYLKASTKSESACRISVTALAIACFLAHRALIQLNQQLSLGEPGESPAQAAPHLVALRDELAKLSRVCMGKLEAGRKSKSLLESAQFIETLMESVQQHERVQYGEGVQLIRTYARAAA